MTAPVAPSANTPEQFAPRYSQLQNMSIAQSTMMGLSATEYGTPGAPGHRQANLQTVTV